MERRVENSSGVKSTIGFLMFVPTLFTFKAGINYYVFRIVLRGITTNTLCALLYKDMKLPMEERGDSFHQALSLSSIRDIADRPINLETRTVPVSQRFFEFCLIASASVNPCSKTDQFLNNRTPVVTVNTHKCLRIRCLRGLCSWKLNRCGERETRCLECRR